MESYAIANDLPTHGYDGPLGVSFGGGISNIGYKFLEMAKGYDKEREASESIDANELSANSINKYTVNAPILPPSHSLISCGHNSFGPSGLMLRLVEGLLHLLTFMSKRETLVYLWQQDAELRELSYSALV
jgi:hypothetical protein